jgi:hypothetical protein
LVDEQEIGRPSPSLSPSSSSMSSRRQGHRRTHGSSRRLHLGTHHGGEGWIPRHRRYPSCMSPTRMYGLPVDRAGEWTSNDRSRRAAVAPPVTWVVWAPSVNSEANLRAGWRIAMSGGRPGQTNDSSPRGSRLHASCPPHGRGSSFGMATTCPWLVDLCRVEEGSGMDNGVEEGNNDDGHNHTTWKARARSPPSMPGAEALRRLLGA